MADNFENYVDKFNTIMFRCAYTYCNNRQDAEDIVQEAFYKYLSKQPSFTNEEHAKAWFLRVTINLSKNYVRSFWHKNVEGIEDTFPDVMPEEAEVWDAVRQLPQKYRIIIELHYLEGYSLKEIAALLGKNSSTIGTWYERGKKLLKQIMESEV